jgi:hypothetical protein
MKHVGAVLLALVVLGQNGVASAQSGSSESTGKQVLHGAGSALGTVVYAPFKAGFCLLGGVASAFTAIASTTTAKKVVDASCRGTWVITPDTLRGKEPVKFVGDMPAKSGAVAKP